MVWAVWWRWRARAATVFRHIIVTGRRRQQFAYNPRSPPVVAVLGPPLHQRPSVPTATPATGTVRWCLLGPIHARVVSRETQKRPHVFVRRNNVGRKEINPIPMMLCPCSCFVRETSSRASPSKRSYTFRGTRSTRKRRTFFVPWTSPSNTVCVSVRMGRARVKTTDRARSVWPSLL